MDVTRIATYWRFHYCNVTVSGATSSRLWDTAEMRQRLAQIFFKSWERIDGHYRTPADNGFDWIYAYPCSKEEYDGVSILAPSYY